MERPDQNDDQDSKNTPAKAGESSMSQRLRELLGGKVEEDSEEEEANKKPKKFRRFFKGLFKNVVQPPQETGDTNPRRPGLEPFLSSWQEQISPPLDNASSLSEQPPLHSPEAPVAPDVSQEISVNPVVSELQLETAPVAAAETYSVKEDYSESGQEQPLSPQFIVDSPNVIIPAPEFAAREQQQLEPDRTEQQPAEREVVIERGSSMALPVVLVGAEYLARKRADRKIERTFIKKIETLDKDSKQDDLSRQQLDKLVKQNREQLDVLRRERGLAVENRSSKSAELRQPAEKAATQLENITARPERIVTPQVEAQTEQIRRPEAIKLEVLTANKESYKKLMEKVADAAEQTVPVERVFERSHEVKDTTSVSSAAASIGAIMAAQAEEKQRIARIRTMQQQVGDPNQGLPVYRDTDSAGMYQQAVRGGFWAAMAIIILGFLTYLLK